MTKEELEVVTNSIYMIDSAIEKSHMNVEHYVYRGVSEIIWLNEPFIGGSFEEKAFGSYSLKIENAMRYTNLENPIIFRKLVTGDMKALYIDNSEFEVLFPRNIKNEIITIETMNIFKSKITVYTVENKEVSK